MVRLEKKDDNVNLNYLIASNSRGKGLASNMLKRAMLEVEDFWKDINVSNSLYAKANSNDGKNCFSVGICFHDVFVLMI